MKVKKLYQDSKIPTRAYEHDAGFDVYSPIDGEIKPGETLQVKLGIAIEIDPDEVCIVSERSGMAIKYGITTIGNVIDSGYRGEISTILQNNGNITYFFSDGDKIAQLLIMKMGNRNIEIVDQLSETQRGENAHTSSGK